MGLQLHLCYFIIIYLWNMVTEVFKLNDGWVPTMTSVLKRALQRPMSAQEKHDPKDHIKKRNFIVIQLQLSAFFL